jgi:branched-subunit amino acid ABC-type transport system permease component
MTEFVQLVVNGLISGSIIAIGAVGVSLVYGILRIVNFAHGDYLTFGAFAAFLVDVTWGRSLVVAGISAALATIVLAALLELSFWRPLRRKRAGFVSVFVASIGLALVLRHLIFLVAGASPRAYEVDVFQVYVVRDLRFSQAQAISIVVATLAVVFVALLLARTTLGKSMRAVSDDAALASVAGINVDRAVVYTWLLAGALAGAGGFLQGLVQSTFDPNMGFTLLLPIFAAVVLGGVGSAYGALVGGIALGVAMEVSTWQTLAGGVDPVYKPVVAFALLVLTLLVRPQGVFGRGRVL